MSDELERAAMISPALRLGGTGFVVTAVAFGPARMGFGLFLPAFREDFALSTTLAGFVASGGFFAFFLALPLTAWLGARVGQRLPVVAGALSACAGFVVVGTAVDLVMLASGVAIAGASAGFCWAPFNAAAERVVAERERPRVLSLVSTGTTTGVAAAGALALAVDLGAIEWRAAWGAFALAGLAAALAAAFGVPGGRDGERGGGWRAALRRDARSLYAVALLFGATNAVYLSFAADRVVAEGGLPGLPREAAAAVIFLGYGACGLIGLAAGRFEARVGLSSLLAVVFAAFAASLALIALAPSSWPGVVGSAGLHGAAVMTISAVLSFWSLRLFPGEGALGFTAALVAVAAGSALGPPLAGGLADLAGSKLSFLVAAAPSAVVALVFAARRRGGAP